MIRGKILASGYKVVTKTINGYVCLATKPLQPGGNKVLKGALARFSEEGLGDAKAPLSTYWTRGYAGYVAKSAEGLANLVASLQPVSHYAPYRAVGPLGALP